MVLLTNLPLKSFNTKEPDGFLKITEVRQPFF
jgi:hypothetical protein